MYLIFFKDKTKKVNIGYTENIEEMDLGKFDQEGMALHGINRNLQRNIPLFADGLKVVHRRVLYAMAERGVFSDKPYVKCAGIVGRTLEKYHPHGDQACYEALIFMGQPWRNIITLVDISGNYGNAEDPNEYSAMRYVECRLTKFAEDCFFDRSNTHSNEFDTSRWDLKSELVDMKATFNGETFEPIYLPAKYPYFLMSWGSGMGYGLATSSPGYLPQDAMQAVIDLIKDKNAKIEMYPEDPAGCTIIGKKVFKKFVDHNFNDDDLDTLTYRMRSDYIVENGVIKIYNTPFEVNPVTVVNRIKKLKTKEKKLDEIINIEVDLNPGKIPQLKGKGDTASIIIQFKKGVDPHVLMEKLYKLTSLENTYSLNCVYVNKNNTVKYNLRDSIIEWITFRKKLLKRKYRLELNDNSKRIYVLNAIISMFDRNQIDEVISIIKKNKRSETPEALIKRFNISDYQAKQIAGIRLQQLSPDSYDEFVSERKKKIERNKGLQTILKDKKEIDNIIISEMEEGIKKYYRPRQSKIIEANKDATEEKFYNIEVLSSGMVRKYETGSSVILAINENMDLIAKYENISNLNKLFVFTHDGLVYNDNIGKIKNARNQTLGSHINKRFDMTKSNAISAVYAQEKTNDTVVFVTKKGIVKQTKLSDYFIASQGSNAIKLIKGDNLVEVLKAEKGDNILIYTKTGKAIMFDVTEITIVSRFSIGVNGIKLDDDDEVIGATIVGKNDSGIVTISDSGNVKKFNAETTFSGTKRGTNGIQIVTPDENIHTIFAVSDKDEIVNIHSHSYDEELNIKDLPFKTRLSNGDKLLRARRKKEVIMK